MLDWAADGSVDRTYPIPCYQQAIDASASPIALYSSAEDDIRRALQRAIAAKQRAADVDGRPGPARDGRRPGVPVPLLVLGGVAILLVALGAVGFFRRRSSDDDASTT